MATLGVLGTTIDFYDFFISGSAAALAWPTVFFASAGPTLALVFSFSAFVVSYLARPFGGFVFGHFADTVGRQKTLIWTLVTMGLGTLGIGLVPSYASLGALSVVLLVCFRILQGFGVGGEWGGAASWVVEFASKSKWRSFWGSWVQQGSAFGILLSSASFTLILTYFSHSAFLDYGWRIPFFVGAAVMIVAAIMRYKASESPLFRDMRTRGEAEKLPALLVLRKQWKKVLILAAVGAYTAQVGSLGQFTVSYLKALGTNPAFATFTLTIGGLISVGGILLSGILGKSIGRRNTILLASVGGLVSAYPFFILLNTKDPTLILVGVAMTFLFGSMEGGVIAAFFTEQFSTIYRASGSGIAHELGGVLGAISPILASALLGIYGGPQNAWPYIAAVPAAYGVLAGVCVMLTRETKNVNLEKSPLAAVTAS